MELSRFTGNISKYLICPICLNAFIDPVQDADDHIFCRKCIETWIIKNFTCPIDRKRLTNIDLKVSRTVKNLLDELDITCDFKPNGCQKVMKWESLQRHKDECDCNPTKSITCPHGCELVMQASKLKEHKCVSELKQECKRLKLQIDTTNQEWKKAIQMLQEQFQKEIKKLNNNTNELKETIASAKLSTTTNLNEIVPFTTPILKPKSDSKKKGEFVPLMDEDTVVGPNGAERKIFIAYQSIVFNYQQKYSIEELRYMNYYSKIV